MAVTSTDRDILKAFQVGLIRTASHVTPMVDPIKAVAQAHEETLEFEVTSTSAAVAEYGLVLNKACKIKSAQWLPSAGLAANGTNFVTALLQKRDGAGGAPVTAGTLDTNSAGGNVSLTAFVAGSFVLSTTFANITFAAGNVLTFKTTFGGAPTQPLGKITVTVEYI